MAAPIAADYDFIAVGSGAGGLAAAVTAAGNGLRTCLLEKGPVLGGGTATSYGTIWAPCNSLAREAGLDDDYERALAYAEYTAGGTSLHESVVTYVRESPRAVDRLKSLGVGFQLALSLPEAFYPAGPGSMPDGRRMIEPVPIPRAAMGEWGARLRAAHYCPPGVNWSDVANWGSFANRRNWDKAELARRAALGLLGTGQALIAHLVAAFVRLGGTILMEAAAHSLHVESGRVAGVRLRDGRLIRARHGVVLATGGYEGNPDLVKRFEGLPDWLNPFTPTNEGDGMVMATELGAAVYRSPVNHGLLVGCAVRGEEFFSIGLHGMPYPGAIAVNGRGERFCDESRFQDVVNAFQRFDRQQHRFANLPAHMVFDDRHRQNYSIAGAPPGDPAPAWVQRAETLGELAGMIGVPAEALEATVRRFNQFATEGEDRDFGRGRSAFSRSTAGDAGQPRNAQLGALDTPPFYAVRLRVGGIVSGGLLIDSVGAVVHVRGHAIPGLYACGNAAAPTDTGVGYQGGTSVGSGVTFGFLAAEHASRQPVTPS